MCKQKHLKIQALLFLITPEGMRCWLVSAEGGDIVECKASALGRLELYTGNSSGSGTIAIERGGKQYTTFNTISSKWLPFAMICFVQ